MDTTSNWHLHSYLRTISRMVGVMIVGIGALVFIGWILDIAALKNIFPGFATMKINTAIAFVLAGLSLLLLQAENLDKRWHLLLQICIGLLALIAILTLLEYLGGWDLKIDQLLVKDDATSSIPGRMSSGTAFAFFLISLSLWCLNTRHLILAQLFAGIIFYMALLALTGYVYGVSALYKTTIYASMALHTALSFLLLCIAILFVYPQHGLMHIITTDSPSGILARRLLPAAILIPFIIGWLQLTGQRLELYDTEFGTALLTLVVSIIFGILIWANTYSLSQIAAERQRVSQALQQSQSRFVRTIEAAMDAIIAVDNDQHIVIFNEAAEEMFGYKSNEILGQRLDRIIPERFRDIHQHHIRDFGATEVTNRRMGALGGISGVRANGQEFPIEASISQIEQDDRKYFTVILRDITERLHNEAALRHSEHRYRHLFQNSPLPMWVFDAQTLQFLAVNEATISHYGYSEQEFLSMTIKEIRPPEDIPLLLEDTANISDIETSTPKVWRHIKKDGSIIFVEITAHALEFDDHQSRLVLANDVTERQQVTEALHESQSRLLRTIEAAMDAIITVDNDQHIMIFNEAAEKMFGYQANKILGQPLDRLIPDRFRDIHQHHIQDFGVTGVTNRRMGALGDVSGLRANGQEFPIEASISQIEQAGHKYFTVIIRDITERLQAEEYLHRLNEELEELVQQRTAHLQAVNNELEAFSYSVSHDLRAPLRAIDGFSQALLEDYTDQLDDDGKNYLNRVRTASQRMGYLIDDLIKLSRISRSDLQRSTVNLSQLAHEIADMMRETDPTRAAEFIIQDTPLVEGDERLLKVLLENLIGNAWKYTSKKPLARIEFGQTTHHNGQSAYFVRDNGAGFDMIYSEKLFGAFQRLHAGNEFEGTGIGLATCKRILHRHGGNIWAEAKLHEGATFYFVL